jgi:hypothetical protein
MLSKKLFISLRSTHTFTRSSFLRPASVFFGSCGTGGGCGTEGGCGSKKKSLTAFSSEIQRDVMENMPIQMAKPTLRNTKVREAYSEKFDRTPHCQGATKKDNWDRDIPLMTI